MWTISEHQLIAISNSMRDEFEKRVYCVLSKDDSIKYLHKENIKMNIHSQINRAIKYSILSDECVIQFIRLSFMYPVMQEEKFDELSNELFFGCDKNEQEKIEILTTYLSSYTLKR